MKFYKLVEVDSNTITPSDTILTFNEPIKEEKAFISKLVDSLWEREKIDFRILRPVGTITLFNLDSLYDLLENEM